MSKPSRSPAVLVVCACVCACVRLSVWYRPVSLPLMLTMPPLPSPPSPTPQAQLAAIETRLGSVLVQNSLLLPSQTQAGAPTVVGTAQFDVVLHRDHHEAPAVPYDALLHQLDPGARARVRVCAGACLWMCMCVCVSLSLAFFLPSVRHPGSTQCTHLFRCLCSNGQWALSKRK